MRRITRSDLLAVVADPNFGGADLLVARYAWGPVVPPEAMEGGGMVSGWVRVIPDVWLWVCRRS
jgi:hypothetical protein